MILQDCDTCSIYTMDGTYCSEARVAYKNNIVKLYFDGYSHSDERSDYRVVFHDKKEGQIHIHCELVIRRNPNFPRLPEPWMADCRMQHILKTVRPDKGARVKVYKETVFRMDDGTTFYATIKEMDQDRIIINTLQPMNKNQHIHFPGQFGIRDHELQADAVGARQMDDGSFNYECCFTGLTESDKKTIEAYVHNNINSRGIRKS